MSVSRIILAVIGDITSASMPAPFFSVSDVGSELWSLGSKISN